MLVSFFPRVEHYKGLYLRSQEEKETFLFQFPRFLFCLFCVFFFFWGGGEGYLNYFGIKRGGHPKNFLMKRGESSYSTGAFLQIPPAPTTPQKMNGP